MIGDQLIYIYHHPNLFFPTLQTYRSFRLENNSMWNKIYTFAKLSECFKVTNYPNLNSFPHVLW